MGNNSSKTPSSSQETVEAEGTEEGLCNPYLIVAAIDFGTTYSGYAFSFLKEQNIIMNPNWSSTGSLYYKTATSVLVNEKDEFVAFGFEAEKEYCNDGPDKGQHLFRNFKMELHRISMVKKDEAVVVAEDGHKLKAIDIFTMAIEYLRKHLIDAINNTTTTKITNEDIKWVITVPAIWSTEAKMFMREAAFKAGCIEEMGSDQLILALEPEAASCVCREQMKQELGPVPPKGMTYLVLDCGGGTNDMVVHEYVSEGRIKELCAVNGGAHGGEKFNTNVVKRLEGILEENILEEYKQNNPMEWFSLLQRIELAKRDTSVGKEMRIASTVTLASHYGNEPGLTKKFVTKENLGVSYRQGNICLSPELVKELLRDIIGNIVRGVEEELSKRRIDKLDIVFLVGGFSECKYLQESLQESLKGKVEKGVLVPREPQLAIVKGAVLYGLQPNLIVSRVARLTYGIPMRVPFNASIHNRNELYVDKRGMKLCENVFQTFVEMDEEVPSDCVKEHVLTFKSYNEYSSRLRVLCIPRKPNEPVQYTTDDDVEEVGNVPHELHYPPGKDTLEHAIRMNFGRTEICVEVENKEAKKKFYKTLEYV